MARYPEPVVGGATGTGNSYERPAVKRLVNGGAPSRGGAATGSGSLGVTWKLAGADSRGGLDPVGQQMSTWPLVFRRAGGRYGCGSEARPQMQLSPSPGSGTMLTPGRGSPACALGSDVVERVLCSCCSSSDDSERNSLHGSISSGRAVASAAERLSCDRVHSHRSETARQLRGASLT